MEQLKIKCPDCEATFASEKALGPHRNKVHGYRVSDGKNDPKRAQGRGVITKPYRRRVGKFPCPQCDFVAKWEGGLKNHITTIHIKRKELELAKTPQDAQVTAATPNGHIQTPDDGNHRLEAAATFAAGRVAQLLEGIALQYDLPPKTLTALVLRTVGKTAQIR